MLFDFLFHNQYLCYYAPVYQLMFLISTWENMHQFYNLKHYLVKLFFQSQIMPQSLTILIVHELLLDRVV